MADFENFELVLQRMADDDCVLDYLQHIGLDDLEISSCCQMLATQAGDSRTVAAYLEDGLDAPVVNNCGILVDNRDATQHITSE